jgi:hypothetical protein
MPNWTLNKLFVSGPKEEIRALKELIQVKDEKGKVIYPLTFATIVPIPSSAKIERYYRPIRAAYMREQGRALTADVRSIMWCTDHWGTKWDAYECILRRESKTRLLFIFDTAWSPPAAWVKQASLRFPRLRFCLHSWEDAIYKKEIRHIRNGKTAFFRASELLA